ncbi:MAG: RagB/SusD family nutrient uptake outer membrane protein [Dysgonamonadaceae bacterium]
MNKLRNIRYTLLCISMSFLFLNSCNYLEIDEYIYDRQTLDSVFLRQDLIKQYLNGAASYLPNESKLFTESWSPFGLAADEAFASWGEDDRHAGMLLLLDHLTPFYNARFINWPNYYKGIRKANNFLARQNECKDLSDNDRREFTGRAYFLLGYYYYLLVQQYGPVPIVTEVYSSDDSVENLSQERNTYDECIEYINECMLKAYDYLSDKRELYQQYIPTKYAALAVLSRVWLYAASPWYNGNKFYAGWITTSGQHFISQVADNSKWGKSAVASKRLIESAKFSLYTYPKNSLSKELPSGVTFDSNFYKTYPDGAAGIDHYLSCMSTFTGESYPVDNPELIYYCNAIVGDDSPAWMTTPYYLGGQNGCNVTQDMVDAFKQDDGTYYNKGLTNGWEPVNTRTEFGNTLFTIVANTPKMYANREARFYAFIGYNHRLWKGTSTTNNNHPTNVEVTYYSASSTGGPNPDYLNNYNRTGYTCVKYIHPEDHQKNTFTAKTKIFPMFRYAEILLNYAEALNELEEPYTDPDTGITVARDVNEIKKVFNLIRYRAGLPGLSLTELSSRETVRDAIKKERRVEFAFEGHRYHDLRRWGQDAMVAYNKPITGMDVSKREVDRREFYKEVYLNKETITRRVFTHKMYLYPIPKSVLDRNRKLVQNPEW